MVGDYQNAGKANQELMQENRILKSEINLMRENAARNQQLQEGNQELINERRSLL